MVPNTFSASLKVRLAFLHAELAKAFVFNFIYNNNNI